MKRGDMVVTTAPGDYGKVRPALIVQDDEFETASVTVVPFTSDLIGAPLLRLRFQPDAQNGLRKPSDLMIDKLLTVPRAKVAQIVGRLDAAAMRVVNERLVTFFGLGAR